MLHILVQNWQKSLKFENRKFENLNFYANFIEISILNLNFWYNNHPKPSNNPFQLTHKTN